MDPLHPTNSPCFHSRHFPSRTGITTSSAPVPSFVLSKLRNNAWDKVEYKLKADHDSLYFIVSFVNCNHMQIFLLCHRKLESVSHCWLAPSERCRDDESLIVGHIYKICITQQPFVVVVAVTAVVRRRRWWWWLNHHLALWMYTIRLLCNMRHENYGWIDYFSAERTYIRSNVFHRHRNKWTLLSSLYCKVEWILLSQPARLFRPLRTVLCGLELGWISVLIPVWTGGGGWRGECGGHPFVRLTLYNDGRRAQNHHEWHHSSSIGRREGQQWANVEVRKSYRVEMSVQLWTGWKTRQGRSGSQIKRPPGQPTWANFGRTVDIFRLAKKTRGNLCNYRMRLLCKRW